MRRNILGIHKTHRIWLCAAAGIFCLALTGCAARSAGGSLSRQGMTALENADYQTALADFQTALQNEEDEVVAARGLGLTYFGLARYSDAADAFRQALEATDDKMPETRKDIRLYLILSLLRDENYPEVVTECMTLRSESGEMTELSYYLGCAYLGQGDEQQARENFDSAVALAEGDYALYLQIYQAFEEQSLSAVGDEYLQKALSITPQTNEDRYQLGQIYYYLGDYDAAHSVIDTPVQENYEPAVRLLGEIYLAQEDYAHALNIYQVLLEANGESPEIYNGLALCALASSDPDGALVYIETGLNLEEEDGKQQLRFNEMVAYENKLDFETALIKAEAYVALYPTDEAGQKELKFLQTQGR